MTFNDIPENSIVRSIYNNQLYLVRYWEIYHADTILLLMYWLYPIDKNNKRIATHEPTDLRAMSANHLEIISYPKPESIKWTDFF